MPDRPQIISAQDRESSIGSAGFGVGMSGGEPGFNVSGGGGIDFKAAFFFQPLLESDQVPTVSRQRISGQTIFQPDRINKCRNRG